MRLYEYVQQLGDHLILFAPEGGKRILKCSDFASFAMDIVSSREPAPSGCVLRVRDEQGLELVRWRFPETRDAEYLLAALQVAARHEQVRLAATQAPFWNRGLGDWGLGMLRASGCVLLAYLMLIGFSALLTDVMRGVLQEPAEQGSTAVGALDTALLPTVGHQQVIRPAWSLQTPSTGGEQSFPDAAENEPVVPAASEGPALVGFPDAAENEPVVPEARFDYSCR